MIGKNIVSKLGNLASNVHILNKQIASFSVWKNPTNYLPEKAKFPSPKELFPKDNENSWKTLNDLTPSLFKDVQGFKEKQVQRAAYMQIAKPNGQMYHIFDASKMPLGRMCQKIAFFLQGKHRPTFKNCDQVTYDNIIVVNAANIMLTGKKALLKTVKYHTGFVGGLKEKSYKFFLTEKPEQLVFYCISKMLPKNLKRRDLLKKVEIYRDFQHEKQGLPNFVPYTEKETFDQYFNPFVHNFEDLVIKFQSSKETPKELEGIKKEIDPEITLPFNQRSKIFKLNAHNRRVMKQWKMYYRRLRRYKVHKIKAPKNRDPNLSNKSFMITSDRQIKDFNLHNRIVPEEVPEDDDEIMRTIPRQGGGSATAGPAKPAGGNANAGAAAAKGGKQGGKK
ncbi:50S ribosomal protein L13 (macronuclear) [Tetrahymena thermophila SB210]|uniref:50S ribosomal protein L13 n=1 Tax=Tetrahymena thermophila (strain SB210) TaxID=312017 RepID=W7X626_TETTS|nr:50S ribosomal protein L13 [Tetrahymena thermophila SB210]EWS72847.1 50S ribosomal protein L13 [Tetrahymena thermophila SB210]6Z1P_Ao Chain Ao, 50S ribosomal protein L13 [Tetrahymena thermophila SB210]|eukprot:XP_012654620.1 50S ribosomal protein L13 [Tetrahymena thermophila SB210]